MRNAVWTTSCSSARFLETEPFPVPLSDPASRSLNGDAVAGIPTLHLLEGSLDELLDCYKEFLRPTLCSQSYSGTEYGQSAVPYLTNPDRSINLINFEAFVHLIGAENRELDRLRFREKLQTSGKAPRELTLILQDAVSLIYYHDSPYEWWKNWYYTMKLKIEQGHKEARKEAASYYSSTLIWYFEYLTKQTVAWDCAYHELYAPTLSDLASISEHEGRMLSAISSWTVRSLFS